MKKLLLPLLLITLSLPAWAGDSKESAFDRVMRTGVMRCGYYVFPPVVYKDPNTSKLSGLSIDYMEKIAKRANLKIEWATEITWANWVEELRAGRYDVACTPMWPDAPQFKVVTFSKPLFFSGIYPLGLNDNEKLVKADRKRLNQKDITILTQEGNYTDSLAREIFPDATFYTLPTSASGGEYYQNILSKKADIVLTDRNALNQFEKTNGKVMRFIDDKHPVKLQSFNLAVLKGERDLMDFINQSIDEMQYNGDTDRLLRKWEAEPDKTFLRPSSPAKTE